MYVAEATTPKDGLDHEGREEGGGTGRLKFVTHPGSLTESEAVQR